MARDSGEIKSGILHVPPASWLQQVFHKPWPRKQCVLYPASRQGVRRLEVFDLLPSLRRKEPASAIIPLNDCLKIVQERHKEQHFVFSVVTRKASYIFAVSSIQELHEWLDALQRITFGDAEDSECPKMTEANAKKNETIDNELYGVITESPVFAVTVVENETSRRLALRGDYRLRVTPTAVHLLAANRDQLVHSWVFNQIRRHGERHDGFVMEVGRGSETGAGLLLFRTAAVAKLNAALLRAIQECSAAPDVSAASQTLGRSSGSGRPAGVKKPPRFRKQGAPAAHAAAPTAAPAAASDLPNVVPLAEKQWLFTQSCELPSPGAAPSHASAAAEAIYVNEPGGERAVAEESVYHALYAQPEERTDAWRQLASTSGGEYDEVSPEWLSGVAAEPASDVYANLLHMSRPAEPPGHLYARLTPFTDWAASAGRQSGGSPSPPPSPSVQTPTKSLPLPAQADGQLRQRSVQHVAVNSKQYAVVDKPLLRQADSLPL